MKKERILNVPNFLSAYRIVAVPFICYSLFAGKEHLFVFLICTNLITDILDGLIARTFKLQTEFGAKLDSIADVGTIVMAVLGMFVFKKEFMSEHFLAFTMLIGLYVTFQFVCLIKFRRFPSMHLYSAKITGYIQGIFIFTFFLVGYSPVFFYFMIVCSCLSYLEELIIALMLPALLSNCRGLYWILKNRNRTI